MDVVAEAIRNRVEPSPTTAMLAVGDVLAIGLFVVLGEISHGVDPLANPAIVLETTLPFLIGWLVVGGAGGVYGSRVRESVRETVGIVSVSWIGADVVAQSLRATELFRGNAALTFFLVAMVVGGSLLVGWRLLARWLTPSPTASAT